MRFPSPLPRLFTVVCAFFFAALSGLSAETNDFPFVTREGDRLLEGGREFRFVSFNHPNVHISENPTWHRLNAWEREDAVRSIAQMGGQVMRIYTLSVKGGRRNGDGLSHVYGPGNYDEELFRDLDHVLALCRQYKVRVILPFIDEWDWFGGIDEFSKFFGKTKKEFYSDPRIQEAFRSLIKTVVTRKNTITGVPYNEDPTILAWESGNELRNDPEEWVTSLAAYVKSLAPRQLFQDGHCGIRPLVLKDPNVDLLTNHYYGDHDFKQAARHDREASKGVKPFYAGEYDPRKGEGLINEVISNGSAGILAWSLRTHAKEGGFFCHFDPLFYHWPYSPLTHEIREGAYRIRGMAVPPVEIPIAPQLLPITSPKSISWLGSTGANAYVLERAEKTDGPWVAVAVGIRDDKCEGPLFVDSSAPETGPLFYRIKASNTSGESPYSPVEAVQR